MIQGLTQEQLSKLPKWAVKHIESLERQIAQRDEYLIAHDKDHPPTRICADPHVNHVWIPSNCVVRFYLDNKEGEPGHWGRPYIDVRLSREGGHDEGRTIEAHAGGATSHALQVRPRSGNVMELAAMGPYFFPKGERSEP